MVILLKKSSLLFLFLWALFFDAQFVDAKSKERLRISACSDSGEWPSFVYFKRDKDGKKTTEVTGKTYHFLKNLSTKHKIPFDFKLLPWRRCLNLARSGEVFDIVTDAAFSEQRKRDYYLSDLYYSLRFGIFYLPQSFPNSFPEIKNSNDLFKLGNICGIGGYSYSGFSEDFNEELLDKGARDFDHLFSKLRNGRCKAVIGRYEIINSFAKIGRDYKIGSEISFHLPKISQKNHFYFLVSKKSSNSLQILELINREINKVKQKR